MNDMATTDTISSGIRDNGTEGHNVRHKREPSNEGWRTIAGYKGTQDRLHECDDDSNWML